jgi:hypothetical protein
VVRLSNADKVAKRYWHVRWTSSELAAGIESNMHIDDLKIQISSDFAGSDDVVESPWCAAGGLFEMRGSADTHPGYYSALLFSCFTRLDRATMHKYKR